MEVIKKSMSEHQPGYQTRDLEIIDYQMFPLGETGLEFRGPQPRSLAPDKYWACLGAAQSFGCFCDKPYPLILKEQLSLDVLNLGYGGAGPKFFLKHRELLPYINNARFVVIQVMSARSEDNRLFDSGGLEYLLKRSANLRLGAEAAYQELIEEAAWCKGFAGKWNTKLFFP